MERNSTRPRIAAGIELYHKYAAASGTLCLSEQENRDLYGRRAYLLIEIERKVSTASGETKWLGPHGWKSALWRRRLQLRSILNEHSAGSHM
jgi:hypothetical protein